MLDLKQSSSRDGSLKTHSLMREIIVDFFNENTSVFSGAASKTRRLLTSRTELLQRLFALLPQMLRIKVAVHRPTRWLRCRRRSRKALMRFVRPRAPGGGQEARPG